MRTNKQILLKEKIFPHRGFWWVTHPIYKFKSQIKKKKKNKHTIESVVHNNTYFSFTRFFLHLYNIFFIIFFFNIFLFFFLFFFFWGVCFF
ncbi:hypothetical protein BBP13_12155 [Limosilactobacillus reuteri]|nr:hypothetical protein BBP13_12155 [Limosilactobacillus reuteri]